MVVRTYVQAIEALPPRTGRLGTVLVRPDDEPTVSGTRGSGGGRTLGIGEPSDAELGIGCASAIAGTRTPEVHRCLVSACSNRTASPNLLPRDDFGRISCPIHRSQGLIFGTV